MEIILRLISSAIQILIFPFSIDKDFSDCINVYSYTVQVHKNIAKIIMEAENICIHKT